MSGVSDQGTDSWWAGVKPYFEAAPLTALFLVLAITGLLAAS